MFLIYAKDTNLIRFFSKSNKLEIKFYHCYKYWRTYYIEEKIILMTKNKEYEINLEID